MVEETIRSRYLDVNHGVVYPGIITFENGYFKEVMPIATFNEEDLDLDYDGILIPGFIDAHIHIESTMLTPANFAKAVLVNGTTSVVADPHEIANVLGVEGIDFMINNGKNVPFDFYFTAPSCVPATEFETSGASIDASDIDDLLNRDEIVALGEMMNVPGVLNHDNDVLNKLAMARTHNKPVDGHAPLLTEDDLKEYIAWGINTEHEASTFKEAIEKKESGMKIMVREGSASKNMDALLNSEDRLNYLIEKEMNGVELKGTLDEELGKSLFDFLVSDDISAKDLSNGHLKSLVKKAISKDIDPKEAIKMVTYNPAQQYNLNSGLLLPGKIANFILVDNLTDLNIEKIWVHGELIVQNGDLLIDSEEELSFENSFNVNKKVANDFDVTVNNDSSGDGVATVNVIGVNDGELITQNIEENVSIKNNVLQSDIKKDILKIAVVNRYGDNTVTNGFVKGFGIKKGAIASSIAHDSHNIVVVGTNSEDMAKVVNLIIESNGGLALVNGDESEVLELPIAGLMSNKDESYVASKLDSLQKFVHGLGSDLESPFATLSFMTLLVIPELKISDKDLFNLNKSGFVELIKQ